ncbi:hypothetical protein G7K_2034-t2 [Saitoella complicata NRRL Y-17804]|uniref:non-specific serine/threonine protein kinase n=1 Tax=Saitoella complicata (strain BCRC 22490 / CBS 7301 / JCM 7358 / NBRC 10748 / NRRL Y-17804) TaxID=698492 RepID=A0A0E9NDE4_SAICN|nr:hypothetical protein G7K_2034-t2 [Saitoella complicata NRRL Y-17804]
MATATYQRRPPSVQDAQAAANKRISQISTASSKFSTNSDGRRKISVGPWILGRTLGRGSSGRVRLAKNMHTGALAAVKIVPKTLTPAAPPTNSGSKGQSGRLPHGIEREVVIMKLIKHPNVMRLYDVWENRGELYLVLEYIEGGELFDYLVKKGRLEESEAADYFRQLIDGVGYCHRFNICHRDLKPENLLLDKNKKIKIADFGMAALEPQDKLLETSCGSPHYASPEIVAGKTYHGAPSDIWSCGIILFALLTGHLPFDHENIRELLLKVREGQFEMPPQLSPEAKHLIWRMLEVNPERRITIPEILNHPFLLKYPAPLSLPNSATLSNFEMDATRPVNSREEIHPEVLKNLQTLWREDREAIVQRLLAHEPNSEKTFYCLLMKYRHDHLENYGRESMTSPTPVAVQQDPDVDRSRQPTRAPPPIPTSSGSNTRRKSVSRSRTRSMAASTPQTPRSHHRKASSIVTVSSAHKRNVSFSHARARVAAARANSNSPEKISPSKRQSVGYGNGYGSVHNSPRKSTVNAARRAPPVPPKHFSWQNPAFKIDVLDEVARKVSADFALECESAFNGFGTSPDVKAAPPPPVLPKQDLLNNDRKSGFLDDVVAHLDVGGTGNFMGSMPMIWEEAERYADADEETAHITTAQITTAVKKRAVLSEVNTNQSRGPSPGPPRGEKSALRISSMLSPSEQPNPLTPPPKERRAVSAPIPHDAPHLIALNAPVLAEPVEKAKKPGLFRRKTTKTNMKVEDVFKPQREAPSRPDREIREEVLRQVEHQNKGVGAKVRRWGSKKGREPFGKENDIFDEPVAKTSWFSKFLSIAPASRTIRTTLPSDSLCHELHDIFRRWEQLGVGISHVSVSKDGQTLRARVDSSNAMDLKSVRFKCDIAKGGRGTCVFTQEKGAASSFERVVREVELCLRDMNVLIDVTGRLTPQPGGREGAMSRQSRHGVAL